MRPYLRVFDDVFYLGKNQWHYFSSGKFSFNESQRFFKDFGRRYFDGASCCFYFGAWKMRLHLWNFVSGILVRYIMARTTAAFHLAPWRALFFESWSGAWEPFLPLTWGKERKASLTSAEDLGLCPKSVIISLWPSKPCHQFESTCQNTGSRIFFFIRGSSFPHN